jgi:hypothetical protein
MSDCRTGKTCNRELCRARPVGLKPRVDVLGLDRYWAAVVPSLRYFERRFVGDESWEALRAGALSTSAISDWTDGLRTLEAAKLARG